MKQRAHKLKRRFTACVMLIAFTLTLFLALPSIAYALSDFSQHKTSILKGEQLPPIETSLEISKEVRNADGSELTEEQRTMLFEFVVTFSDKGSYPYSIKEVTKPLAEPETVAPLSEDDLSTDDSANPSSESSETENSSKNPDNDATTQVNSNGNGENTISEEESSDASSDLASLAGNEILPGQNSIEENAISAEESNNTSPEVTALTGDEIFPNQNTGEEVSDDTLSVSETSSNDENSSDSVSDGENASTEESVSSNVTSSNSETSVSGESLPSLSGNEDDTVFEEEVSNDTPPIAVASSGTLTSGGKIYLTNRQAVVFPNLPQGIEYTVTEKALPEYVVTGIGHSGILSELGATAIFVNTLKDETFTASGRKTWNLDRAPEDFVLPENITVSLMDGDEEVSDQQVTPNANGEWLYTFTAPKYRADGTTRILYTIAEDSMPEFTAEIEGFNILNRYTLESPPTPETPVPETPTPETPIPETPTPETPTPETPTPEIPTPETPIPETPTPETPTPEAPTLEQTPIPGISTNKPPESDSGKMNAKKVDIPKTDDASNVPLWILLMFISATGLLCVWVVPILRQRHSQRYRRLRR